MDLPLAGGSFTSSNNQEIYSLSNIDRFIVSPDLDVQFPLLFQKRIHRLCYDHFPICNIQEVN